MLLILKEEEWLRGTYTDGTLFRPTDQKRCCFGVLGRECEIPDELMSWRGDFADDSELRQAVKHDVFLSWFFASSGLVSSDASQIIKLNDSEDLTDEKRLELIAPIFARHGISVEFQPAKP